MSSRKFRPSSIPHFSAEAGGIGEFFTLSLSVEFIDDVPIYKSYIVRNPKSPDARNLREALEYLLRERPATDDDWAELTGVRFWGDDHLYAYLQDLYDYIYGDRKEPPESPDDAPPLGYGV
ncbi:hypothetical protein [Streptomyces chattanoogensis]|uniref:CdiI immunity protein domain-containing protein n=1 Tax=Streptomyces chattanoogensis TaxID=66876 RepID=A0A0N1JXL9_9ACTN|nr:hypothetical protein [Streptomyces chattanoogensis]KPC62947.1 hypothetical protein ADL29_16965 [Streptomyces chattanoogensis]